MCAFSIRSWLCIVATAVWLRPVVMGQVPTPEKRKLWAKVITGTIDIKGSRMNFDFPPEVYFSPAYRWSGQVAAITPPIPKDWLNTVTFGVNVHPLPLWILNNLAAGCAVDLHTGYPNSFRDGSFLSRAQYANGENAFTYARLSGFSHATTFRAVYDSVPIWTKIDREERTGVFLELGPKYTLYRGVEVTQGYDTFNEDVVYRKTRGHGETVGGSLYVKTIYAGKGRIRGGVRLGIEYEKGRLEFAGYAGRRPFSKVSIGFFGFEIGL